VVSAWLQELQLIALLKEEMVSSIFKGTLMPQIVFSTVKAQLSRCSKELELELGLVKEGHLGSS
jgi:hypothetical protein